MTSISEESNAIKVSISMSFANGFRYERLGRNTASSAIITAAAKSESMIERIGLTYSLILQYQSHLI
jgi:hypothetical protein